MERRRIGRSDLEIVPLMLGGNVFGWTADAATSFAILDAFIGAGFNGVDTADAYSNWVDGHVGGESETVIGAWLNARGGRDRIVLATKVGSPRPGFGEGLSAAYIERSVEASLNRLQTDYIDLYQSHQDDPHTPIDETLEAYDRLIKAGKIRAVGASHYSPERLAGALETSEAQGTPRYDSFQPRHNLCDRGEFEGAIREVCREHEVGVLAYSGLAKGYLSGKHRPVPGAELTLWETMIEQRYVNDRGRRILAALEEIAQAQQVSCAEVALAWLIAQPGVTAPIVAVNSVAELNEIKGAVGLILAPFQQEALTVASAP